MDKRTLLFVVSLSLTLLGVNIFFQYQNTQKKELWLEQHQKLQVTKQQQLSQELSPRIASPDTLPITSVFADSKGTEFLSSAILIDDQILLISWSDKLPETLYSKPTESHPSKKFTLTHSQNTIGTPALYRANSTAILPIFNVPDFGFYDLQLVSFHHDIIEHPVGVTLGQYADGHFSLPLNGLSGSTTASIALYKTANGYLPVGYYDPQQKTLLSFQNGDFAPFVSPPKALAATKETQSDSEKFYVLEDSYQQLVFSNYGGAIAEINLPFRTKENTKSIVREIEIDREMVKDHPYNAYFPDNSYFTSKMSPDSSSKELSLTEHEKGKLGGYYPLIRRDLIESGKRKSVKVDPQFYALNIVSEYPETAHLIYKVTHFDEKSIVFEATQYHRRIIKSYSFDESVDAPYCLNLEIKIEGDSRGLWLTTGVPEIEWISGGPAPALKYRITRHQKADVENIDLPKDAVTVTSLYPDWICSSNGFFGTILDPLTEIDAGYRVQNVNGTEAPSRLIEIDQKYNRYKAATLPGYTTLLPLNSHQGSMKFRFFAGPFEGDMLKQIDAFYTDPATNYNPDYIACQTMHGWFTFISEPFAKFLLILMKIFHSVTGSWGFSIILLTIALRIMMYPLNTWSTKSMTRMQLIAPEVAAIQEKHKSDPKKAQLEVINLYREKGVNPASGCLPLLIQMPFLIGMFDLLKSSFALRGVPFVPGWINDLTAPDVLFSWNYPVFFIGTEFHLLPLLLAGVMFAQQRLSSTAPKDVSQMTDQQRQQKAMGNIMAGVFAIMFYHFPSGLNIYWLSSMLLGMLQQWQITRKMKAQQLLEKSKPASSSKKK